MDGSFIDGPPAWREWQGARWYYNTKMGRYRGPTGLMLAVAVWCWHNGEVPDGYEIHHINEDKTDDRLENLEAVLVSEHRSHHGKINGPLGGAKAGSSGAHAMWDQRGYQTRVCDECSDDYETRSTYSNYCGKRCRVARAIVVSVSDSRSKNPERSDVYDLTIEDAHEFFAEGILVLIVTS